MRRRAKFIIWPIFFLAAVAALSAVVMLLWNAVLPGIFAAAPRIDYLHALGLLVLCRILFGGLRGHGHRHGHERWAKWQAMTPEEREQFHRHGQ
jgi:ABC-type multidrug transport system fused ATPase/permease subunit